MPKETIQTVKIEFGKGIDESQEASMLPEGFLTSCLNWVPEPTGGLRSRVGWSSAPNVGDAGYPANKSVRGLFWMGRSAGAWWVAAFKDSAGDNELWAVTEAFSGNWREVTTSIGGNIDSIPIAFAKGETQLLFSHPSMANLKRWNGSVGTAPSNIAGMTKPGRALAYHKNRFFSGGGTAEPYRLYFSELGSVTTWNLTKNYIDIGKDDGEPILDLKPFQGNLVIGKEGSVFVLTGAGASTFSLTEVEHVNCAVGRTLISTPTGLVILGDTEAWLWQGGPPQPISTPVRTTYKAGKGEWRMGAFCGGELYVGSRASGVPLLVFNMERGSWRTEDVGSSAEDIFALTAYRNTLVGGIRTAGTTAPVSYKEVPYGSRAKDAQAVSCTYSAQTPDFYLTKTRQQVVLQNVWVRYRQRSTGANGLTITPYKDGVAGTSRTIAANAGAGIYYERVDVAPQARSIGFKFSTTVPSGGGALYDIEEITADLIVNPAW